MRYTKRSSIYVLLIALAFSPSLSHAQAAPQPAPQFPPKTEELQKRVKEFYGLLFDGKIGEAENYVTTDTRKTYEMMKVTPFDGSDLQSIELDPSGKSATVLVQILYESPMVPGTVLRYPRKSKWLLEKGDWRMQVEMTGSPDSPKIASSAEMGNLQEQTPKPQKTDLQFEQTDGNLGVIQEGDKKEVHFSFKNATDHPVTISGVETGCDCLKVLSGIKMYQPGESGELVVAFDSGGYRGGYKQTIFVKTEPGDLVTYLLVEATPLPGPRPAAGPSASK